MAPLPHSDRKPFLRHTHTTDLPLGSFLYSLLGHALSPSPSFRLAQDIFQPNLFLHNTPTIPSRLIFLLTLPMKMEQCSKTSAHKILMLGNHPKARIQLSEHGKSLKSWMCWIQRYNKHDLLFYFSIYIQNIYLHFIFIHFKRHLATSAMDKKRQKGSLNFSLHICKCF